jgi:expansin (peptidoglycan-binding protein)
MFHAIQSGQVRVAWRRICSPISKRLIGTVSDGEPFFSAHGFLRQKKCRQQT